MDKRNNCFFCNTQLGPSRRNSFNIFKTIVFPLERKASELIADVLDVEVTEGQVHSDIICRQCFKLVNEFADLENRAAEIRTDMLTHYNSTREMLEKGGGEEGEDGEEELVTQISEEGEEEESTTEGGAQMTLDADKLNQLVADASGGSLQDLVYKTNDGSIERPKLLVVNDGGYEEIGWEEVMGGEEEEDDQEDEEEEEEQGEGEGQQESQESDPAQVLRVDNGQHVCKLCPLGEGNTPFAVETANLNLMSLHLKHEHDVRLYPCDVCGAGFKKRGALLAHLDGHVREESGDLECNVCFRVFTNLRLFRIHKRQHNSGVSKAWCCGLCSKKYSSRNLLEEHMNTHLGVKPYQCTSCSKAFASKYTYRAHLKTHEKRERNFPCPSCGKTFLSHQNLLQHIKTHSESRDFVCDTCGKGFGTMRSLEVHNVVHSGVKPFVCRMCGKAFARKAEIKDHERTHTGERPFQCEHCGAQFSQRSNLQSHKRVTHYNDRRYQCGSCGKGFKRRRLLDYHVKAVHTGERPYACETCDATFVYPEHYKKHIRIHTGVKPYKCEVCEKAFNSRDNRNAHRFVHSDKKPYECLVCGVGFMRKPLLYNHMQQAGHVNDTIVVNQPRLDKDDLSNSATGDQDGDYELTIVDENSLRNFMNKQKVYLTESSDQIIIQGSEKTLFAKLDDGNIKTLTSEGGNKHLVDEDGNFIDLEGNIISVEQLEDDSTMMAHINEHGQLVNEDGQVISEDGQALLVDESVSDGREVTIKRENISDVHYVEIGVPEDKSRSSWLNVKAEASD